MKYLDAFLSGMEHPSKNLDTSPQHPREPRKPASEDSENLDTPQEYPREPRKPTWEDLAALRWGPAALDPEPGIILDHPDHDRLANALADPDTDDTYALAERQAIQEENAS